MKFAYLIEPPFNYLDEGGKATGCDVELARYVFRQLGFATVEFVETEFAHLLPGLARGGWQMTTGLFATDDRRQHALFSRPIWALPDGLLVRKTDADRIVGYQSLARSDDLTVAVIRDQIQHQTLVEAGVAQDRIHVFETYADAAQAVQDGRVNAYASVARAHLGHLQQNGPPDLALVEISPSEKPPAFGCYAFARDATDLKNSVDRVLNQFLGGAGHLKLMREFGFDLDDINRVL